MINVSDESDESQSSSTKSYPSYDSLYPQLHSFKHDDRKSKIDTRSDKPLGLSGSILNQNCLTNMPPTLLDVKAKPEPNCIVPYSDIDRNTLFLPSHDTTSTRTIFPFREAPSFSKEMSTSTVDQIKYEVVSPIFIYKIYARHSSNATPLLPRSTDRPIQVYK